MIRVLALATVVFAGILAYEYFGGERKIEPAVVLAAAFEAGEMSTSYSSNGNTILNSTVDQYRLIVEFVRDDYRELIVVDKYTYLNVDSGSMYDFECQYGGISKEVLGCVLDK